MEINPLKSIYKHLYDNADIIWDIYHNYKNVSITFSDYTASKPELIDSCRRLSDIEILSPYAENNYIEIQEPYISFIEKVTEGTSIFVDGDIKSLYEELASITKRYKMAQSSEERTKLEFKAGRLVMRAFNVALKGTISLDNERRNTIFESHTIEEKIYRLEEVQETARKVNATLSQISEFIFENDTLFRFSQNNYLVQVKYYFRNNLGEVVSRLQHSLKDAARKISFYEMQQQEMIDLRNLIKTLDEHPEYTNIEEVSASLAIPDTEQTRKSYFFYPDYLLNPENPSVVDAVIKCEGNESLNDGTPPVKIITGKKQPPKTNPELHLPPLKILMSDFRKSTPSTLFDFMFNQSAIKNKAVNIKYNMYIRFLKFYFKEIQPSGKSFILSVGSRRIRVSDFILKNA